MFIALLALQTRAWYNVKCFGQNTVYKAQREKLMLDRTNNEDAQTKTKTVSSSTPVPLDFNLGKCALTIKSSCGECLHFKRMAYPPYKKVCSELGIIKEQKPCPAFATNPERIEFASDKDARNVARAIQNFSPRQLKNFAAILNQEERTRKQGFSLGQVVYFRAFGDDYISNYVKAYVLYADSKYVHVEGKDGFIASIFKTSVMTQKKWDRKELLLLQTNKQRDPRLSRYTRVPSKTEKNIQSIIDKTIATLSSDTKISTAVTASKKLSYSKERHTELPELLSVSTR